MFGWLHCWLGYHAATYRETRHGERLLICSRCERTVRRVPMIHSRPAHETLRAKPIRPADVRPFRKAK